MRPQAAVPRRPASAATGFLRAHARALLIAAFAALAAWLLFARPAHGATVDPAVRDAIAESASGNVYVVILLRPIEGTIEAVEAEVPLRQSRALAAVDAAAFTPVYRYRTFPGMTGVVTAAGLDQLAASPEVESIALDQMGEGALNTSVPYIGANQTYNLGVTGADVTVAVLDSGINTTHADLSDDVAPGAWHFLGSGANVGPGAEDDNGHGSNVSGIITARGITSSRGVAPDADILAVKVLDAGNFGSLSDWAAGVDYVVANRASYPNLAAINMSLVTFTTFACGCDNVDPVLRASIAAAKAAGIPVFVSSGNLGVTGGMAAPACFTVSFPVAAVHDVNLSREPDAGTYSQAFGGTFANCFDATSLPGTLTCFSCRNACNQIAAPGRNVIAPWLGAGIASYTGTSQAAPHAAGLAALIRETRLDSGLPALLPDPLLQLMKSTGSNAIDPLGVQPLPKVINALLAVNFAVPPTVTLISPNGGEHLLVGSTANVQWAATDNVGVSRVDLFLSTTGSAGPFNVIASGLPNSGSALWVVEGTPSSDCWLRVTARDASAASTSDVSNAAFTIEDPTTATVLQRFDGRGEEEGIRLTWRFEDASEFTAVAVERATAERGPWSAIPVERRTTNGFEEALDRNVAAGATWWYRLAGTDRAGDVTTFAPIAATANEAFAAPAITRLTPNPSTGPAEVEFVLPRAADASVRLLDVQGRVIATLASGPRAAGRHRVPWSGIGMRGPAAAGLYFVELRAGGVVQTRRWVLAP